MITRGLSKFSQALLTGLFVLSIALQGIQPAAAQDRSEVRIGHNAHTGKVSFIGSAPGQPLNIRTAQALGMTATDRALSLIEAYAADFGLKEPARELRLTKTEPLPGRQVTKYQQVYQGDLPLKSWSTF